jgi:hypothetical protein
MALGIKIKNVTLKNEYTIETLYEAIKDKTFSAGVPELTKNGLAYIITFPAIDRQNQVWVMMGGIGSKPTKKVSIQKSQKAGMGNLVGNMALDQLTGGFFGLGGIAGKNTKACERLVEATAKELSAMDL